ncbi:hypothetical protein RIF29_29482 [Crotalaria pallida]|uniref:Uncharacterized protein n=1 Tax=Crotalaria pallida TaxID=3830 RepID=A0AAN9EEM8_CROPI
MTATRSSRRLVSLSTFMNSNKNLLVCRAMLIAHENRPHFVLHPGGYTYLNNILSNLVSRFTTTYYKLGLLSAIEKVHRPTIKSSNRLGRTANHLNLYDHQEFNSSRSDVKSLPRPSRVQIIPTRGQVFSAFTTIKSSTHLGPTSNHLHDHQEFKSSRLEVKYSQPLQSSRA